MTWKTQIILNLGFAAALAFGTLGFLYLPETYFLFWEQLSPDGYIEQKNVTFWVLTSMILVALWATIAICCMPSYASYVKKLNRTPALLVSYCAVSLLVVVHIFAVLPGCSSFWLTQEDAPLEVMTAVLAGCAGTIYLLAAYRATDTINRLLLLAYGIFFLIFCGEEISWGQRIFDWQTPAALTAINFQNETNLHNTLINVPLMHALESLFSLFLSLALFKGADVFQSCFKRTPPSSIPNEGMSLFSLVFLILSIWAPVRGGELLEEVLSVFGFTFALIQVKKRNEAH